MNIQVVTEQNTRKAAGELTAEASTLGFPPGKWPTELKTTLGNKKPFFFYHLMEVGDEVVGAKYKQVTGLTGESLMLTVFND